MLSFLMVQTKLFNRKGRIVKLKPTQEQSDILAAFHDTADSLKIQAYAGTGKTATLLMIAEANPGMHFQYVAFNKALEREAKAKFPSNVKVNTAHALAYRATGMFDKQEKLRSRMSPLDTMRAAGINEPPGYRPYAWWVMVRDVVRNFERSADSQIDVKHVSSSGVPAYLHTSLADDAKRLWRARVEDSSQVAMEHDTYLKVWQLEGGKIKADCILFDEAQDANGSMLAVVAAQKARQVYVGDTHQQIYGWRGAVNAMDHIRTREHAITQSFRFGDAVARAGSNVLRAKGLQGVNLRGLPEIDSCIDVVDYKKQYTSIHRTNADIIMHVFRKLPNIPFHVVGGVDDLIRFVESGHALRSGDLRGVKDDALRHFKSWYDLQAAAEFEPELRMLQELLDTYSDVRELVRRLARTTHEGNAAVTLTTAHKAKGREWDQVRIADDFLDLMDNARIMRMQQHRLIEEINLIYVAVTRAKLVLDVSETRLGDIIQGAHFPMELALMLRGV